MDKQAQSASQRFQRFDALPGMHAMPVELIQIISDYYGLTMSVRRVAGQTWASYANGDALTEATFNEPMALIYDRRRRRLICCDTFNQRLRQVSLSERRTEPATVSTMCTISLGVRSVGPHALCVDPMNPSRFFIAALHRIVAVLERELDQGVAIEPQVGYDFLGFVDGPGITARFDCISDLRCDSTGDLFVADTSNNAVRLVRRKSGVVVAETMLCRSTDGLRGLGTPVVINERLVWPVAICVDPNAEHILYVLCRDSVEKFDRQTGQSTRLPFQPVNPLADRRNAQQDRPSPSYAMALSRGHKTQTACLYIACGQSMCQLNPDTGLCVRLDEVCGASAPSPNAMKFPGAMALAAGEPGTLYCVHDDMICGITLINLSHLQIHDTHLHDY